MSRAAKAVLAVVLLMAGVLIGGAIDLGGDRGLAVAVCFGGVAGAVWILGPRPSPVWLRLLVPAALLLGGILSLVWARTVQPDPFGLSVSADVVVHCGSVLHPGDVDYGCGDWIDRQRLHAIWLIGLAAVVFVAVVVDWIRRRRTASAGNADPDPAGPVPPAT